MNVNIDDLLTATHDEPVYVNTGVPVEIQKTKQDHFPVYAEKTFSDILERLANGERLNFICRDPTMPQNTRKLRTWIFGDEDRKEQYYEALAIGAEVLADEVVDIADGVDEPMEDVARSTLRVNTRKWLAGVNNRDRFGQKDKIDATFTINIGEAMNKANERVIELSPSDVKHLS